MPTLYDCATAPSPRRARIVLAEKAIAHDTVAVDLAGGEHLRAPYRAVNPQCTVPALVLDDGTLLGDNASIAAWAEAVRPEPPLFGTTPEDRACVASWHWRAEFEGLLAVAEALRNRSPAMAGRALPGPVDYAQIPQLAERGLERLAHFCTALDAHLADGRATIASGGFSIADVTALVAIDFARIVKVRPAERFAHIGRWRAALAGRPSVSA